MHPLQDIIGVGVFGIIFSEQLWKSEPHVQPHVFNPPFPQLDGVVVGLS